jgi:hypothetical protein
VINPFKKQWLWLEDMAFKDFLRNIVNTHLSRALREGRIQANTVDEVRRLLAAAESKYGFSSFGGNPERLIDYFNSKDFDLLAQAFKGGGALDVLVRILEEASVEYADLPGVSSKARELAKALSEGRQVKSELTELFEKVKTLFPGGEVSMGEKEIVLKLNSNRTIKISYDEGKIRVVKCETTTLEKEDVDKLREVAGGG